MSKQKGDSSFGGVVYGFVTIQIKWYRKIQAY